MKIRKLLIGFFIGLILYSTIGFFGLYLWFENIETPIAENNIIYLNPNQDILEIIEETAINISDSREYKLGFYDCTQFSRDLVKALKEKNISAYCVSGFFKKNIQGFSGFGHTWVEVNLSDEIIPIEATGGYIIDEQVYEYYYVDKLRGYCI
jgi:uncharacterized membrane protein YhdT